MKVGDRVSHIDLCIRGDGYFSGHLLFLFLNRSDTDRFAEGLANGFGDMAEALTEAEVDDPSTSEVLETPIEIVGSVENYDGRMHWDGYGGDVAPNLFWCEAISFSADIEELSLQVEINLETRQVTGSVSGFAYREGISNGNPEIHDGTFSSTSVTGTASAREDGNWNLNGTVRMKLEYLMQSVCMGEGTEIVEALDHGTAQEIDATLKGDTLNGICVIWVHEFPDGRGVNSFTLKPKTIQTWNCE